MANKKNTELLREAKEKIGKSEAVFFVDYQGLTHKQLEEARIAFKQNDAELSVLKNTLVNIAFKEDKKIDLDERLTGPLALLFSYRDVVKTAKLLNDFFKKYNLPKVKFGIFEGKVVEEDTVLRLASLPSREILLAQLVGLLKGPMNGLVYNLNWNIAKLVFVLKAVEDNRSKVKS